MRGAIEKRDIARQLQAKINAMQGLGKPSCDPVNENLAPFSNAFPNRIFPTAALHEFISYEPADAASTNGFITALAGKLMKDGALFLWIGNEKRIFPSGIKHFGLEPDRIIFINVSKPKEALWTIEEALKCEALTGVIGEIKELGFTESRRLQLAVERSGVTAFIHRFRPLAENATASTTRWKVMPLAGVSNDGMPGLGHSCWDIHLLKVRNGRPDSWQVTWSGGNFMPLAHKQIAISSTEKRQAG